MSHRTLVDKEAVIGGGIGDGMGQSYYLDWDFLFNTFVEERVICKVNLQWPGNGTVFSRDLCLLGSYTIPYIPFTIEGSRKPRYRESFHEKSS